MRVLSSEQIQSEICGFVSSLAGQECAPDADLKGLGIDSIAFLEIIIFIEKKLHIPLPLELITSQPVTTVASLTRHLTSLLAERQSADA